MQQAPSRPFPPIEAGSVLVLVTLLGLGLGAVVGWAAGAFATGLIVGAIVGLPGGIVAVYRRYRGYFT